MKKEHPIFFKTPMVKAILENRKTITRRICRDQSGAKCFEYGHAWEKSVFISKCPYGKAGDLLWVKETSIVNENSCRRYFVADGYRKSISEETGRSFPYEKMVPSLFMPKLAARIWLEIIDIKVERLQDITPNDAIEEGINYWNIDRDAFEGGELMADFENYMWRDDESYEDYHFPTYSGCIDSFKSLWQSINGEESWNANPWVWVIEFKKIKK